MANEKVGFNDPIHGYLEFDPLLLKIIHTPYFQRMKDIKQLGASYWIFPGASHNRFEHSLGTAHLAGMMIERLRDVSDHKEYDHKEYVTPKDILCVKIAALCHDLGHGPFSHVFEKTMKNKLIEYHESEIEKLSNQPITNKEKCDYHEECVKKLKVWEHEDASCAMFDYMIEKTEGLKKAFEERNLKEKERKLIKNIIMGIKPGEKATQVPFTEDGKEKWFLFEIVANKVNEIDCDKFDYFARDCHNLGMKSNFDHLRYINNISIMPKPETNELHLCVRDKLVFNIYELFHTRWSLHHRAYQHKTTKAIEEMITDAFVLLEDKYKFSEAIFDMEKYAMLTDSIFYEILRCEDTDEKTMEAQNILKRIQQRNLYKFYDEFQPGKKVKDEDLKKAPKEIAKLCNSTEVDAKELLVSAVNIGFGQEEKNPVESVIFYDKDLKTPFSIRRDEVSKMLPQEFTEQFVRVYDKNFKKDRKQIVVDSFKKWQKKYLSDNQWTSVAGVTALAMMGAAAIVKLIR